MLLLCEVAFDDNNSGCVAVGRGMFLLLEVTQGVLLWGRRAGMQHSLEGLI